MRKRNYLLLSAASVLFMASCSKMGPLSADNFTVTPNPLESQGGKVAATVNGTFPEKYMKKKAVVTVTPELRYANGQVAKGQSATFQGEKVMGNDQTISYKVGGRYTMKTSFDYVPEMQKSDMYLTFDARKGRRHTTFRLSRWLTALSLHLNSIAAHWLRRTASSLPTHSSA